MIEVERLSSSLTYLLKLLASKNARYIAKYTLDQHEGFPMHYHRNVNEYIILLEGQCILRYKPEKDSTYELKLIAENTTIFVDIPKKTEHELIGLTNGSTYIVVKEFDDAMLFSR